jgi:hypothetical protein
MTTKLPQLVTHSLNIAKAQLGVHEIENSNKGPEVNQYLASVHCSPGQPWCAAFWFWTIRHAAHDLKLPVPVLCSGSCRQLATWAENKEILMDEPQRGDAFLRWGTVNGIWRAAHIGHVEEVYSAHFQTIEGNSNTTGDREGISVVRLDRVDSPRYKFIRWANLLR